MSNVDDILGKDSGYRPVRIIMVIIAFIIVIIAILQPEKYQPAINTLAYIILISATSIFLLYTVIKKKGIAWTIIESLLVDLKSDKTDKAGSEVSNAEIKRKLKAKRKELKQD